MEFDNLKGFYYVAKLRSFTGAAERLFLTQPAISLQVKALENELGERLFDRVGRSIKLTHAGSLLYSQVEGLIGQLDEIERTVVELKKLERGRLSLGASDTASIYILPALLKLFFDVHPKVDLCITSLISAEVIQKVMDREIDLGIITLHSHGTELEALPLFDHRLVAVVSPEHPLSSRKVLDLEELARERLILLERASITRQRIDGYFQMARCDSRPILELSNFEIIKRYVAAGLGVSLVPEVAVSPVRDGVCAIPLRPALSLPIGVIFRRDRKLSQPGKAFLTMAEEFYRAHQASSRAGPEGN